MKKLLWVCAFSGSMLSVDNMVRTPHQGCQPDRVHVTRLMVALHRVTGTGDGRQRCCSGLFSLCYTNHPGELHQSVQRTSVIKQQFPCDFLGQLPQTQADVHSGSHVTSTCTVLSALQLKNFHLKCPDVSCPILRF